MGDAYILSLYRWNCKVFMFSISHLKFYLSHYCFYFFLIYVVVVGYKIEAKRGAESEPATSNAQSTAISGI